MNPVWLDFIIEKRRQGLLQILQELTGLQDKKNLNFVIIGALPLLIRGYLQYKVHWDIDLLFKNKKILKEFITQPKSKLLKIVDYDDKLMVNENITSFHTAWAFNHTWFNVDYILGKESFKFYTSSIDFLELYRESIKRGDENFEISLYMADPWDIFISKIISPRTARDVKLKIDTAIDLRHIFAIYQREKNNIRFWQYIFPKAKSICTENMFKSKLLEILLVAGELGYTNIDVSTDLLKTLQSS